MSHYVMGVIIEKNKINGIDSLFDLINNQISKYDENLVVEEYEKECYCKNHIAARLSSQAIIDETGKDIDMLRKEFNEKFSDLSYSNEKLDQEWAEFIKDYLDRREELKKYFLEISDYSKDCVCFGSGHYPTTYNPNSKFDYFAIGGRWDGILDDSNICCFCEGKLDECGMCDGSGILSNISTISNMVNYVEKNGGLFGYVTPDRDWIERGEMGWWGMVSNEKEKQEWKKNQLELLKKYNDDYIVIIIDCHI